jgi:YfiH family protein
VTGRVRHRFTDATLGSLAIGLPAAELEPRRRAVVDLPWTWLRQEHGPAVVVVREPGEHAGAPADAAVAVGPGAAVAVHTADCGPVLLRGEGAVGVVHAGWRGLAAGVLEATIEAMVALGAPPTDARIGPLIRARCYEFGVDELDLVAARCGPAVRATTAWGTPALDVAAGIAAVCAEAGIAVADEGTCTACSPHHFSHRARGDAGRQALVAWIEP